jgi:hypothetical protein
MRLVPAPKRQLFARTFSTSNYTRAVFIGVGPSLASHREVSSAASNTRSSEQEEKFLRISAAL